MSQRTLSEQAAYLAMYQFLQDYYDRVPNDELAMLLGSMSLLPGGTPADPAYLEDWQDAVTKALDGKVSANLQLKK